MGSGLPCRLGYAALLWQRTEFLGDYAWFIDNSGGRASNVGRLWPNAFGLFDSLGNVAEWTQDVYAKNPAQRTQVIPGLVAVARFAIRGNQYSSSERMPRGIAWGPQPRVLTIRVGSGSRIRFT